MDDLPEGETVEFEPEIEDVEDTADGGAIVKLDEEDAKPSETDFYRNLADDMAETDLQRIATQFIELLTKDKEARARRDKQQEEGLRRTGLGDDAPGGAQFEGASKVVHPMLTEACVDFAARAIKELWPAGGPVKTKIEGEETKEKEKRATRKARLMNWQLTVQVQDARSEVEQGLTKLPLGGAHYLKMSWDVKRNRPGLLGIGITDILLPYAATNFYSAQRKTHVQYITQLEFEQRVKSGMYRDVDLAPAGMEPELSASGEANNKIEGREANSYNEDGLRTVWEVYATAQIEDGEEAAPYIITIDKVSSKILSIYRNWDEQDDSREELTWIVELPFIPWDGAYPLSLSQMIGGLSGAATGALRALLDSAHIQNTAAGVKLKSKVGGQTLQPKVGEIVEVEGGLNSDDVRKMFMPMPFNPPSPVLFELLGFLVDAGKSVVRTAMDEIADQNPNAPVGTTLANIEQGLVVYSAIHGRLHDAMGRMLRVLHRLNEMYLDDEMLEKEAGEDFASREDFTGPMDVVPVSDPNIFSEAQRFAQIQAVAQRAALAPDLYNRHKVEEGILKTLKIPNPEEYLVPATGPEHQNAVNENVAASLGRAIVAYPEQDHIAHLQTHLAYLVNPTLGSNPLFQPTFMPVIIGHLREHLALWYMQTTIELAEQFTGLDLDKSVQGHEEDGDNRALDRLLAQASTVVSEQAGAVFQTMQPVIAQAQQMAAQYQQPQPMDPTQATIQVAKMQLEDKQQARAQEAQEAQQNLQAKVGIAGQQEQTKQMTLAVKSQIERDKLAQTDRLEQQRMALQQLLAALDQQIEQANAEREAEQHAADMQVKLTTNEADNQTALTIAEAESEAGGNTNRSTGTGIGGGN